MIDVVSPAEFCSTGECKYIIGVTFWSVENLTFNYISVSSYVYCLIPSATGKIIIFEVVLLILSILKEEFSILCC